ncbi:MULTISPECIES: LacI family DNA-binding transcriptional regulator [Sinorhizobium]|uniref:LacI family DNA-binding transcriptional regulator n=1 Tax=Sinorhizobium TaxID=28105 RepID=UPI000BE7915D|nr:MULTISPECIES: LacI family DNA-binding transcriptional regulator [Sinorhizobium]PDT50614.1 LacI family transcriptional regulator [Sinorhizobium sp. NG07B]POH33897.1 LacI family transcriptional regulator [Sinorhizobium americanum]
MTKRPTISDLARESGLSVATVDRVLNARHPVREETARRVYEAARALGYPTARLMEQRRQQNLSDYRLGFILKKPAHPFFAALAREVEAAVNAASSFHGIPSIEFVTSNAPGDLAVLLKNMGARCHAIAMVAPDHPTITAAVEDLKAKGVPVFSLLSDFAAGARAGYVGLNNRQVGRTAAWMVAKAAKRPGKVAVFVAGHRSLAEELREIGFRSYFRENAQKFEVLATLVSPETRQLTYEATLDIIHHEPELIGFYVPGGAMEGAIAALRERRERRDLVVIVNEITPDSRAALADGVITMAIATPLRRLCRELTTLMARVIETGTAIPSGQIDLPFEIYLPENIPYPTESASFGDLS